MPDTTVATESIAVTKIDKTIWPPSWHLHIKRPVRH